MKRFADETKSGKDFIFQAAIVNHTTNTMLKIKSKLFAWVLTVGSLAITSAGAHAQNANYAPGDLVMFFQLNSDSTKNRDRALDSVESSNTLSDRIEIISRKS
jgi:hypothetical protein